MQKIFIPNLEIKLTLDVWSIDMASYYQLCLLFGQDMAKITVMSIYKTYAIIQHPIILITQL